MAGQIIKRGTDTWLVRVFLGRDPATGKRRYLNETVKGTKKEAQQRLTRILREQDTGTFVEPSKLTVNDYLDQWLETAARPRLRANTYTGYEKMLRVYVRPTLGGYRLDKLTALDIQRVIAGLQGQGLKARTIRYAMTVLSNALKQAVRWGVLASNPAERVTLPKQQKAETQALSPEEVARFLDAAAADRWGIVFTFALATGMRPSEVAGLQWRDVDLDARTVAVRRALTRKPGGRHLTEPKTPRSRRSIPLPEGLVAQLREHRRGQDAERAAAGAAYQNDGFVFAGPTGKPIAERTLVERHFKPTLAAAGLPSTIRYYDLRHTCATLLLSANVHAKVVSERLGHSTITLTMDTYSHVLPSMQQGAADALHDMLYGDKA